MYRKVWVLDNIVTSRLWRLQKWRSVSLAFLQMFLQYNSGIKFLLLFSECIEPTLKLGMCQLEIRKHLTLTLKLIKLLLHWSFQHLFHLYAEMLVCVMGPFCTGGIGCCDQPYADKIILLSACLPGIASGAGNIQSNNAQCWVLKIVDVKGTFSLVPYPMHTSYIETGKPLPLWVSKRGL